FKLPPQLWDELRVARRLMDEVESSFTRREDELRAARRLMDEVESSFTRWEDINRREQFERREEVDVPKGGDAERGISEELRRLLHELARVAKMLYAFSGDPSHAASRTFSNFAQSFEHAARAQLESEGDRETWAAAIDIKAGPWALHLTGTAVPKSHLEIGLRKDQEAELPVEAFLTLV